VSLGWTKFQVKAPAVTKHAMLTDNGQHVILRAHTGLPKIYEKPFDLFSAIAQKFVLLLNIRFIIHHYQNLEVWL
jgi:hypothetical protein